MACSATASKTSVVVVGVDLVGDVGDRTAGGDHRGAELLLELDRRLDPLLGLFEAVGDDLFGHLRRTLFVEAPGGFGAAGLHHHDGDVAAVDHATGDDELEGGLGALLERRVGDPLAPLPREAHRADRAVERDARHGERGGGAVDRQHVVRVDQVGAHDRGDDLDLVAEALGEARPQRTVGEPTGEDGGLAGPTLTPEDAAGDLARGVHALLDVDGQREEVDALTGLAGDDGAQDGGVAHPHEHRAVGLGRELARLQGHLEARRIDGA